MISKENLALREAAKRFSLQVAQPYIQALPDTREGLEQIFALLREHGYIGLLCGEAYGGRGYTFLQAALIYEGLAYGEPLAGTIAQMHDTNAAFLQTLEREDLAETVGAMARGEMALGFAFTETSAGSDPSGNTGVAVKKDDGYHITAKKLWVTHGSIAARFLVFTNKADDKGMYMFLLDRDTPGMTIEPMDDIMYGNIMGISRVTFDDCVVPEPCLLSDQGHRLAYFGIDTARICVPAVSIGLAQRALDETVSFLRERESMGSALLDKESLRFELAALDAKIEAARQLLYTAAEKLDAKDEDYSLFAAKNKLLGPAVAQEAAGLCVQLHGGAGLYRDGYPARALMMSRMLSIMDGSSEIQQLIIGRALRKNGGVAK